MIYSREKDTWWFTCNNRNNCLIIAYLLQSSFCVDEKILLEFEFNTFQESIWHTNTYFWQGVKIKLLLMYPLPLWFSFIDVILRTVTNSDEDLQEITKFLKLIA